MVGCIAYRYRIEVRAQPSEGGNADSLRSTDILTRVLAVDCGCGVFSTKCSRLRVLDSNFERPETLATNEAPW